MSQRPYKPTALRALEGGRSHSLPKPGNEAEVKPSPIAPPIPSDIDTQAKKVWGRLAPKLVRLGLLTETDGDAFANLCQIRSRLVSIYKFIKKENRSLVQESEKPSPDGGVFYEYKPSPYIIMEKQYLDLFRKYASEFGLTPRARVGLTVGTKEGEGDDLL